MGSEENAAERRRRHAEYQRGWYRRNREKVLERERKRRADDAELRERARQRARAWYATNRDRALEKARARYAARPKTGLPSGEQHHAWRGDAVGYTALHRWVVRHRGRPSRCEHCGTTSARRYEWANVDHRYRRVLDDYLRLCTTCHRRYDYENGLAKKGGRRKRG